LLTWYQTSFYYNVILIQVLTELRV
jgi:hypothetical protein